MHRYNPGLKSVVALAALLMSGSFADRHLRGQATGAQPAGNGSDIPTLPYKLVDWPNPPATAAGPPGAWNFIQVASVASTERGNILLLHRGAFPIMEFDSAGKLLRSGGEGLFSEGKVGGVPQTFWGPDRSRYSAVYGPAGCTACGAHSVRVDPRGDIWVVDAPGHVVYKLNPDWKEVLRLGTKGVAGTGPANFNLPTDVGFAPNGDVYVSDGYGSARVVKYTREGKYLLQFGHRGTGDGEFGLPHNLVVDRDGRVYVSDRDNQRVEVFDSNGRFLSEWKNTGGVSGVAISRDQRIWTGGVLHDLKGSVLGRLPGASPAGGHGVTVTNSGDVYIAQLGGVVQKFVESSR
jgi:hypothetical protein